LKRGMRATHETLVTFADGGALTVRAASTRADYLNNADEFESRPVTLEKVKYAKTLTRGREGVRVRASVVPFGAEGVDAVSGGVFGGSRRGHQLTGFGADGGDLIGRCHTDSMGALAVEFNPHTALHLGVFTGNRQPEDGRGKVLAQLTTKRTSSTKHTNVAINASRSQDGETLDASNRGERVGVDVADARRQIERRLHRVGRRRDVTTDDGCERREKFWLWSGYW
jgi:hypothetical protein